MNYTYFLENFKDSQGNTLRVIATDLGFVQKIDRNQEKDFVSFYV